MKNKLLFYFFKNIAILSRLVNYKWYMKLIVKAYQSKGVKFVGKPRYIHQDASLDASGGLTISKMAVISTKVIVLSHDYSFLKRGNWKGQEHDIQRINRLAFKPVFIGENSFIGAGAIVLPGTRIGKWCIIGAGAVVKGIVEDFSIMAGNPAKKIGLTNQEYEEK